jgi:hypothetical protein
VVTAVPVARPDSVHDDGDVTAADKSVLVIVVGSRRQRGDDNNDDMAEPRRWLGESIRRCTTDTLYSQQTTPNTSTTRHHSVDANDDTLPRTCPLLWSMTTASKQSTLA